MEKAMKEIIQTPHAPAAVGPYSQGIKVTCETTIYCSGQIALDPQSGKLTGVTAAEQAEQVLINIHSILLAGGADMKNVVKTKIFFTNIADFTSVNEVYAKYFTLDMPARVTVEVGRLPKEAKIMIEAVAVI